ncbi:hypothetical protein AB0L75_35410 [Streptomyces sp. NPDC052101]|uniref:hypothetical protein n=1 Tax=Streptomyces sp. NPDC052101 TaxID=3155763 RepID=UPI00341B508D
MSGLRRQVLAAFTGEQVPTGRREHLLALGAAELAHARRPAGGAASTSRDVQVIALQEFGLLLDDRAAAAALAERQLSTVR